jgi:signal peptide peptidase SppA
MKYSRIVAEFYRRPWILREQTLTAMEELIRLQSGGVKWSIDEIRERIAAANAASGYEGHENREARFLAFDDEPMPMLAAGKRNAAKAGSVAVIPMTGIISHRMSMMSEISGGSGGSTVALTAQFRQALEDGNCKAIVLDVDSPGGSVEGVMELAQEIYDARKVKPVTAVCNAMACSAAYWLASAAKEVVCTPSGQCGSIGVYMMLQDESEALKNEGVKISIIKAGKYKAEGHPSQPLTDEAREFLQGQVDSVYSMFVKAVAQQRGVAQAAVRDGMGQGRSLLAADAVKAGLADRTGTLDDVLEKYGVKRAASGSGSRASAEASASHIPPSIEGAKQEVPAAKAPKTQPDDEDGDSACGCSCGPCEGCTGPGKAEADGDMSCSCPCSACQACAGYKSAALTTPALTAEEEALANAAAAGDALALYRRRRLSLL